MDTETSWAQVPLSQLVDHIQVKHHTYTVRELNLISALLSEHTRSHWMRHPEFLQAHTLFHQAKTGIEQHLMQEETAGFMLIRAHEKDGKKSLAPFLNTIGMHEEAHSDALSLLRKVKETLWNGKAPEDLDAEVTPTLGRLDALITDLVEHIHLENDILFPRAKALGS